jgi:uncharacterized protein involved in type VI secretion and phage assembly
MPEPRPDGDAPRYFGLYPALVTNIVDPDRLGRIEVRLPFLGGAGDAARAWATLLTPYADDDQGFLVLPAVGTQVVVGFEAGVLRRPYIVGSCWNGREALPETPADANDKRLIKTRAGSLLEFDDAQGAVKITLSTATGYELVLDEGAQEVTLQHANGCFIKIDVSGEVQIQANASVEITAPQLNVHAATATFDGIINCTTVNCNAACVSPSYSPGAGNIW